MGNDRTAYVDFQQRASEFEVGDRVCSVWTSHAPVGRVQAVWPSIGMVDVEWPHGSERLPVEELQQLDTQDVVDPPDLGHDNIPGGAGTVSVPGGPAVKLAQEWVKKALYWASPDRHYRATQAEVSSNQFTCPKCKEAVLRSAVYKRSEGVSERLLGCPACLFLVKRCDVIGHPEYEDDGMDGIQAGGA